MGDERSAAELKEQGNECFNSKRFGEAVALYTRALELEPGNAALLSNRSAANCSRGKYERALADARACVEADPSFVKGYSRMCAALMGEHKYAEAVAACDRGLELDPQHAGLRRSRKDAFERVRQLKAGAEVIPQMEEILSAATNKFMEQEGENAARGLDRNNSMSLARLRQELRAKLEAAGTDVAKNDADAFGDGDQSPAPTVAAREILRETWASCGDVLVAAREGALTPFAMACFVGDARQVRDAIGAARTRGGSALRELLERRETTLRLSPLLFGVSGMRQVAGASHGGRLEHEGVIRALLDAGARVDCRDATGKGVVHYGAGAYATDGTLAMVRLCAAKYGAAEGGPPTPLADLPDRTGAVALHEVVMAGRADIARALLGPELRASPSVREADGGITPERMVQTSMHPELTRVFRDAALARALERQRCAKCGQPTAKMFPCSRCHSRFYCGAACQKAHWRGGHKQECAGLLEAFEASAVTVQHTLTGGSLSSIQTGAPSYVARRPADPRAPLEPPAAMAGKLFFIKCQVGPVASPEPLPILCYDHTRHLVFNIEPGATGYVEVDRAVRQHGVAGRKAHVLARIGADGTCTVFLSFVHVREW